MSHEQAPHTTQTHTEHTTAYHPCGSYFQVNFSYRAETEGALGAEVAEGLRAPLGLQGDECEAETEKREGEGTGEKKETWKGV